MRKISLYICILILAFSLTISLALRVGSDQPIPDRVAMLHLGDMCALPCWIGITPGKTTVIEAEHRIATVYNQIQLLYTDIVGAPVWITAPSGLQFWVFLNRQNPGDALVQTIELWRLTEFLDLADIMTMFGTIGSIKLDSQSLTLIAETAQIEIALPPMAFENNEFGLYPSDPVRLIELPADKNSSFAATWQGIGNYTLTPQIGLHHVPVPPQ